MKRIGSDSGAYEQATFVDSVILGPSERAIVDILIPTTGTYKMQNKTPEKIYTLGTITINNQTVETTYTKEFMELQTNISTSESIDAFRSFFDKNPDKEITLTLDMMSGMGHGGQMMTDGSLVESKNNPENTDGIEWNDTNQMMNQMSDTNAVQWKITDTATKASNMDIVWNFQKNVPVKIRIVNDPNSMHPMQHPIHFHGQRFLVTARNGVKQTNLVWKDTTLITSGETVDIILDPSNVGTWMAHCHISEHLANGMMFTYNVK
jgi:FtsP/CotA-like multicopper oxidase with cupredoxin domain